MLKRTSKLSNRIRVTYAAKWINTFKVTYAAGIPYKSNIKACVLQNIPPSPPPCSSVRPSPAAWPGVQAPHTSACLEGPALRDERLGVSLPPKITSIKY